MPAVKHRVQCITAGTTAVGGPVRRNKPAFLRSPAEKKDGGATYLYIIIPDYLKRCKPLFIVSEN